MTIHKCIRIDIRNACVTFSVTFLRLDMDEYKGIFYEICFKCTQTTAPKTSYEKINKNNKTELISFPIYNRTS